MRNNHPILRKIALSILLMGLFALTWFLRSWNLGIGDGQFCCKMTVGEQMFAISLSRSTLSLVLYRWLFFILNSLWGWWVEDCIALSSCLAGVLFFWALFRLARASTSSIFEQTVLFLFPSTSLIFQIFCGHIEFYSWTCALLMLSAYWSWRSIHDGMNPFWASAAIALSAGFHLSGVFYFPALLIIPFLSRRQEGERLSIRRDEWERIAVYLALFLAIALFHRQFMYYRIAFLLAIPIYFRFIPQSWKDYLKPGLPVLIPWLALYSLRAFFGLRSEPIFEHLPPVNGPYDPGVYLYEFFSWGHLHDKLMFHLWLAPFGAALWIYFLLFYRRAIFQDRWLSFLANFCFWSLVWSILFYNQLRDCDWYLASVKAVPPRDWDLFATMSIPLNLFAAFACVRLLRPILLRALMPLMITVQLFLSLPIVIDDSGLLTDRGYVDLKFDTGDRQANVHVRQLKIGVTPVEQKNIRAGWAEIIVIPVEKGYSSWTIAKDLRPGEEYLFEKTLEKIKSAPH
ncbi:MAG: hypothetical protein AB1656_16900 [Candidatus Omnitrophota bacterium]